MKVKELIALLEKENPEAECVKEDGEFDGFYFITKITTIKKLVLDYYKWCTYFGVTKNVNYDDLIKKEQTKVKKQKLKIIKAVVI